MGILFALVLGSFFLHVLGQFWKPAESILFLGVLHYYQPFEILQSGRWAWGDMIVLATVGAACWTAGGHVLARRNISVP
jgi:hypothetical protein